MKKQAHRKSNNPLILLEQWVSKNFNPIALRLALSGKATISDIREAVRWEKEH